MAQMISRGPSVAVKPQPNIYTLLVIVAALVLAVAVVIVLKNLMGAPEEGGYGLTFGQVFNPTDLPLLGKK